MTPAATSVAFAPTGASEFKLPELGENISQGDLVRLMISPGTKVAEGQPVMELETDKAVVEVPSFVSGVVKEVKVKEGEKVKVGQVIFTLEGGAPAKPEAARSRNAPVEHVSGQHGARAWHFRRRSAPKGRPKNRRSLQTSPSPHPHNLACPCNWARSPGPSIASRFRPRRVCAAPGA